MNVSEKIGGRIHWRAVLLILASSFIYYFPYDHLQPLMRPILEDYNLDLTKFNLAYTLSDIPTIITLAFVPFLVRWIGSRTLLVVSVACVSLGQLLIAFSTIQRSFVLLLVGRVLLGLLREPLMIVIQILLRRHFPPNYFRVLLGLQILTIVNAKILNVYFVPGLLLYTESLSNTLFICWLVGQFSTIAAINYLLMGNHDNDDELEELEEKQQAKDMPFNEFTFAVLVIIHILQGGCFKAFSNIAVDYLQNYYHFSVLDAGYLLSLHYIAFALLCPLLLAITARYKHASIILFGASSAPLVAGLWINTHYSGSYLNALISVVLYAVFLSLRMATVFPLLSQIELPERFRSSSLNFAVAAEAIGFVAVPLINSLSNEEDLLHTHHIYSEYLHRILIISIVTLVLGVIWSVRYYRQRKAFLVVHID